jgi:hypothetical protein
MRGVTLVEEYKSVKLEDVCAAEPLLRNVAVLRKAEAFSNYRKFYLC